jgi:hypothetical protein
MSPNAPGAGSPTPGPRLQLRHDASKVVALDRSKPLTIGRDRSNRLCLASFSGVADHHAVVRHSRTHGWLVCDWGSREGTFLEGRRLRHCRPLEDGDEIQIGSDGPVLVFQSAGREESWGSSATHPSAPAPGPAVASPAPPGLKPGASVAEVQGRPIPLAQIRAVHLRSDPRYPHSFSWWALVCLGGLLLLPLPWLFLILEIGALAAWIVLGSRQDHTLVITLHDGMAYRHRFASRSTALAHRDGLRRAIGQSPQS